MATRSWCIESRALLENGWMAHSERYNTKRKAMEHLRFIADQNLPGDLELTHQSDVLLVFSNGVEYRVAPR